MKKLLVVGVIVLFLGMTISSSIGFNLDKQSIKPLSSGNILYVGGNGTGNYSKIQDAINDSSNGDTVFVYDDSSPYYENVVVKKSINLIGENRDTTSIDGNMSGDVVYIFSDWVNISGFTIQNSEQSWFGHGISVSGEYSIHKEIHIWECNLIDNGGGIRFNGVKDSSIIGCYFYENSWSSITIYLSSENVAIKDCRISKNGDPGTGGIDIDGIDCWCTDINVINCTINDNFWTGIWIGDGCLNVTIYHNFISENNRKGILVSRVNDRNSISNIHIHDNIITQNGAGRMLDAGIAIQDCHYQNITINSNHIFSNNGDGVYLLRSSGIAIECNNLINNTPNGYFEHSFFNQWKENYWDDWIGLRLNLAKIFPKIIFGRLDEWYIPWINFDWHPAQEPYDIGV